eukprot:1433625-Rhodomonas_salina.3
MSESVLFSRSAAGPRQTGQMRSFDNDSQQYVHYLASMMHGEPIVERCFETVVSHTLMKGITCEACDGGLVVTPRFKRFIDTFYVRFAQDAIRMFFTLGFVVWRIRRMKVGGKVEQVPEVLPLGTFQWTVQTQSKDKKRTREDEPLVFYNVTLNGVECEFEVFEFIAPDYTMECISPLSTVIQHFIRLQVSRTCKMRSDEWNSSTRFAVEHNEKMLLNQMADDGSALHGGGAQGNSNFDALYDDGLAEQTQNRARVVREQTRHAGLPEATRVLVLPKNHSIRSVDSVEAPNGMPDAEMEFQRSVCYALGVPCALVIQQHESGTTSSKSAGDSTTSSMHSVQMLRNTCTRVAERLCVLLKLVYGKSFDAVDGDADAQTSKTVRGVELHISCTPLMELGDIVELHFRKFVEDAAVDEMLQSSIGFSLSKTAERLPWNKTVQEPKDEKELAVKRNRPDVK